MKEQNDVKVIGLDLGNRYGKTASENYTDEIFVAWKEVSEEEFNSSESTSGITKVRYNGKNYLVGDVGTNGINKRNKGDSDVKNQSNMIKLVMIGRYLKSQGIRAGEFKVVTGTPYDDYEKTKEDYISLFSSNDFESIEIDNALYQIRILETEVTKQGASVILTLPDRKSTNYLIWDFGGETLDVSYFENSVRITGQTIQFALNRIFVELGKYINKFIDVDRPELSDARYQKSIETLILTGKYKNITVIKTNDKTVELAELVHLYLENEVNTVIAKTVNELNFNTTTIANMTNVFVGGGAKLLEKELLKNTQLDNKRVQEQPQFSNVKAYYKIGKVKWM